MDGARHQRIILQLVGALQTRSICNLDNQGKWVLQRLHASFIIRRRRATVAWTNPSCPISVPSAPKRTSFLASIFQLIKSLLRLIASQGKQAYLLRHTKEAPVPCCIVITSQSLSTLYYLQTKAGFSVLIRRYHGSTEAWQNNMETQLLCLMLFRSNAPELIRWDLLICPKSFECNSMITSRNGVGGKFVRCSYEEKEDGTWGYIERSIQKISFQQGLLAIFVLYEISSHLALVQDILRAVVPQHAPDMDIIERNRSCMWAFRAVQDLMRMESHFLPLEDLPNWGTYTATPKEDFAKIQETAAHLYNLKSLLNGWDSTLTSSSDPTYRLTPLPRPAYPESAVLEELSRRAFVGWIRKADLPDGHMEQTAVPIFDWKSQTYIYLGNFPDA